ncbi:DNA mismatch repair protein PMS1 [Kluyveromyces marxianus DMKU3-1042]|uniref:DNA mismatch repair protein PMS1 n=1 Tax=Kluyveromyces marxianus (strain DMKU3-1042 / BCC 29191 / NBRC 104275) TaxID=1003335 RepID=W0T8D1_KLUMD|nr:DNA mismatch repair protein PMS1 [Kluyveromyces marxianus DMKU3-1042]BAO39685.1 DNA mismatch repair protein PMS1 [Kluyveromyces marxianus DMKU3-1042]
MGIQSLDTTDIHKITSGQVIIDLRSAVKELIENSLDAKADKIDIVFKNYGIESIECTDNGTGISESDLDNIGLKHRTSKISSFEDVSKVTSFGFRGEAIASLCQMGNVSITTTTKGPKAYKVVITHGGKRTKTVCSRNTGTTITVSNLFDTLPVRKKDFVKNHKRQFSRSVELIQSYALIQTNVKISVSNILPSGRKTAVLSSTGKSDLKRNLLSIFGSNAIKGLENISLELSVSNIRHNSILPESFQNEDMGDEIKIQVTGMISMISFGCGRATKDRQYIYINGRPVEYPKVAKTVNEMYQSFNNIQYPTFVLNFIIDPKFLDLNITPDKRTVVLHYEEYVLDAFKEELNIFFQKQGFVVPKSDNNSTRITNNKRIKLESLSQDIPNDDENTNNHSTKVRRIIKEEEYEITPFKENSIPPLIDEEEKTEAQEIKKKKWQPESDALDDDVRVEPDSMDVDVKFEEPKKSSTCSSPILAPSMDVNAEETSLSDTNTHVVKEQTPHFPPEADTQPTEMDKSSEISITDEVDLSISEVLPSKSVKIGQSKLDSFLHRRSSVVSIEEPVLDIDEVVVNIDNNITTIPASQDGSNALVFHPQHVNDHNCSHTHHSTPDSSLSDNDHFEEDRSSQSMEDRDGSAQSLKFNLPEGIKNEIVSPMAQEIHNLFTTFHISLKTEVQRAKQVVNCIEMDRAIKHERLVNEIASIEDKEKAEDLLSLTVSKSDFKNMNIVGQFNLGFIIVTRCKKDSFDLFIIDQHASDEKYNFESLQKNTVFRSQSLLAPKTLELSVIDELLVMEYENVFSKNGFKLQIDPEEDPGKRVKLVKFPVSKNTTFTEYDFHELIQLIREHEGHNMSAIRCSKVRSMFAMRACRSSIMIGKPLSHRTMKKVVSNLGELDKPWNCPHGRPTLRHLMELKDWDSFYDDYMI